MSIHAGACGGDLNHSGKSHEQARTNATAAGGELIAELASDNQDDKHLFARATNNV